ncbi:MAG: efflux RND transporter permease subunit [Planctomycetota bacterium]|jgi:CzcA family heavy metal efflux pump
MMNRLIGWSIKNRFLVMVLAAATALYGVWVAYNLPIDVLPDLNRPTVTVMTESHGMVPVDVERLVTYPLEQALNGTPGVLRLRSVSGTGLSILYVEFDWGSDIYRNRQLVQERLQLAMERLPEGVTPELAPISSVMGQVRIIGLKSRDAGIPPTQLRHLADQVVRIRLLSVPGVAQVVPIGSTPRQLQVIVDADKLVQYGVTLAEVEEAVKGTNLVASGGMMPMGPSSPLVVVPGLIQGPDDLAGAVVKPHPLRPVRVKDVARVAFGPAVIRTGDASVDGEPGVVVTIYKQPDTDTVALDRRIDRALEELRTSLPKNVEIVPKLYSQADFIERSIDNVSEAIRDGAILVVIVLMLFLLNLRTTLITLLAIPMSIALTALVFSSLGLSINTMTLGGLAIAIGCLVDDAIVDVENVFRRLKENRARGEPVRAMDVVYRASIEVRGPVIVATVLICLVYIPLFAMHGIEGRLFTPIGISYVVSIAASLLVAMTLTPALCTTLLPNAPVVRRKKDAFLVRGLKRAASTVVRGSMAKPVPILMVLTGASLIGGVVLATRGANFLPPFDEGAAQVNILLPPGTGIDAANEFGRRKDALVMATPGVAHAGRRTGRSENDSHAHAVNFSETLISFDIQSGRSREQVLGDLRSALRKEFPGVISSAEQPIQHALSHLLSGVRAQVAVKVYGPDLDLLRKVSVRIEEAIRGIPGVVDLYREQQTLVPQVEVKPHREALSRLGISVEELAELIELALEGEQISRMIVGQQTYPITLLLEKEDRGDLDKVRNLLIAPSEYGAFRVRDVADVTLVGSPNSINRENASRLVIVQHNVEGRSLAEVVGDLKKAIAPVIEDLPPGYAIRIGGQYEAQQSATQLILILSILSGVLMFVVLFAHLKSLNLASQVMAKLAPSLLGGVVFLLLTGQEVSVAALVGFIALAGIVSRNGILLIDHYIHLLREGMPMGRDLIDRGGRERMAPVVMTALTSGIALVPLLLAGHSSGRELLWPVATVIVGGLLTSTLLDFVFTPALFFLVGQEAARRRAADLGPLDNEPGSGGNSLPASEIAEETSLEDTEHGER